MALFLTRKIILPFINNKNILRTSVLSIHLWRYARALHFLFTCAHHVHIISLYRVHIMFISCSYHVHIMLISCSYHVLVPTSVTEAM